VNKKPATPKDAAAVILLNEAGDRVLWARRNPQIAFLGGWHAFPGGKLEASDALVRVENCEEEELEKFVACAVREAFEEVGVLLVKNGEKLTRGQRASLHDDLISGRMTFAEITAHWNLWIDAADFDYTGFWTTPQFSPVRFKTRFFLAVCPSRQTPRAAISELENVEFIKPSDALKQWEKSEVLISPPVLLSLKTLARTCANSKEEINRDGRNEPDKKPEAQNPKSEIEFSSHLCSEKLLENSRAADGNIQYIELNPRVVCFPLKTETLPPATHTNCFIVGRRRFVVIDAASEDESEQNALHALVDSFIENDFQCQAIIATHLHRDHIGGETVLQTHLKERFDLEIPLAAHRRTADDLAGKIDFQKYIEDGDTFDLEDADGKPFELKTLHAPGHASGLLAFYDEEFGFLLSGDNVVGYGSVVIAPPEGNLNDYLTSLERMKDLPNLRFLCGSHGAAVFDAKSKIESYIAHRLERERQILQAIENGAKTAREIVERVYTDISPALYELAEKSVEAHLEKLREEGKF
jgi:glyoxylase-like metal-dependent hydrolase (beta-lactamase superfamily II)/8-oxo-dGTP pyrophosphatase MutT (NUDIX family)